MKKNKLLLFFIFLSLYGCYSPEKFIKELKKAKALVTDTILIKDTIITSVKNYDTVYYHVKKYDTLFFENNYIKGNIHLKNDTLLLHTSIKKDTLIYHKYVTYDKIDLNKLEKNNEKPMQYVLMLLGTVFLIIIVAYIAEKFMKK